MGRIVGIDFGTTNSLVAYMEDGRPKVIPNTYNEHMTPSVVGQLSIGRYMVGKVPKKQYTLKPQNTVVEIKKLIGSSNEVIMGDIKYSPQEISSIIIKELKKTAEKYIGEEVSRAVITVPAGFNHIQRRKIIESGELAGLEIEGIINEPTAAILAYAEEGSWDNKNILVCDLGGGTLDITVAKIIGSSVEILASRGNQNLGGKDFDKRISDFIVQDFLNRYRIDLRNYIQAMARIEEVAEIAKIELSSVDSTDILLPFIHNDSERGLLSIDLELTKSRFHSMVQDLVNKTERAIKSTLMSIDYDIEDIDIVIPVGGSTKLNCIEELLIRLFGNKVKFNINPDEAVVLGAAIYAEMKSKNLKKENNIDIYERCSHSLGISIAIEDRDGKIVSGIFDPIILRNTQIPCSRTRTYYTLYNDQVSTEIKVYQGESKYVDDNLFVGKFSISGIPKALAGREKIGIRFEYDSNGMLEIDAEIISTGQKIRCIMDTLKTDEYIQKFEKGV